MGNGGGTGEKTKATEGRLTGREPPSSSHASKRRRSLPGGAMADRFFPNHFPDFVAEAEVPGGDGDRRPAGVQGLLSLPYARLSDRFLRAARLLKDKVVEETWVKAGRQVTDYTLYTGALGTALLLFKSFQVTGDRGDLALAADIARACDVASQGLPFLTFICGRAGVCALGAVIAKHCHDQLRVTQYLSSFDEITVTENVPNELLYGRAGYLWACLFLNKHLSEKTIPIEHIVFHDDHFKQSAAEAAEVVWNRGLLKRVGICHGVSGNAYTFLSLYRQTGNVEYLYRAKAFACFLLEKADELIAEGGMHGGDRPFSLFEGKAGMAYLLLDMVDPSESRFPAYEL